MTTISLLEINSRKIYLKNAGFYDVIEEPTRGHEFKRNSILRGTERLVFPNSSKEINVYNIERKGMSQWVQTVDPTIGCHYDQVEPVKDFIGFSTSKMAILSLEKQLLKSDFKRVSQSSTVGKLYKNNSQSVEVNVDYKRIIFHPY